VEKKADLPRPSGAPTASRCTIRWKNVGHASIQILATEGMGSGAPGVGFRLTPTREHDAGLGVGRPAEVLNLRKGVSIEAALAPGRSVDCGLSFQPGTEATIVLRGNFPSVSVPLPVPRV